MTENEMQDLFEDGYFAGHDEGFSKGLGVGVVSAGLVALLLAWLFA